VAGERGAHRDVGGFGVADFADQDHVRVVAQDGAQHAGEGEADPAVDLDLADAAHLILDRIFHGDDLGAGLVEARQQRVERGGLS